MKLESLESSKFEAFKGSELLNSFAIVGGHCSNTYKSGAQNLPSDSMSDQTNKVKFTDGTSGDIYDTICPTGPGESQLPIPFTGDYNDIWNEAGQHYNVLEFTP